MTQLETSIPQYKIAVLVPCFNEELTVGKTVTAFREALPSATLYVYDNNSTDGTVDVARSCGRGHSQRAAPGKRQCRSSHVRRR